MIYVVVVLYIYIYIRNLLVMYSLVSLINDIPEFVVYLVPKQFL